MNQPKTPVQIIQESYDNLDPGLLESYLDFQEAMHKASGRDDILRSREFRCRRSLEPIAANQRRASFFAIKDGMVVGYGQTWYLIKENETNPESIEYQVDIHPKYRRQGIGSAVLELLEQHARDVERTKPTAFLCSADGIAPREFAKKAGFELKQEERSSRLYLDNINWDYIEEKEQQYEHTLDRYTFMIIEREEWADKILNDDTFAAEMANFHTEVDNLIPRDEIDMEDVIITVDDLKTWARYYLETSSVDSLNAYAFDGDKVIGLSGTYFQIDPPIRDIGTGLTAVRKAYHKQGIATLLKITVLREIIRRFPDFEYIYTENATSNQGMLSINYNLGFKTIYNWELWQRIIKQ